MKKIAVMQPYLFPYIGYFQLIKAVDEYVIYDDVQYIKNGWINRNNLLMSGGPTLFTIILNSTSPNKLINEIEIVDDFHKFQKTISMAYSKAPYKDQVLPLIERICSYPNKNLADFIRNSFEEINKYLGIDTKLINSSSINKDNNLKGEDKVIAICKELHADTYINAIGGVDLYSKDRFKKEGIELKFLKTGNINYKQLKKEFVPNLSILDVLMFNSPEQVSEILNNYELI